MAACKPFCPEWSWWIRSGERIKLGLRLESVLSRTAPSAPYRVQLERVQSGVQSGKPLVEALRAAGMRLPVECWCLMESGERSGLLGEAFQEVGTALKERRDEKRALIGQVWYPAVVGMVGLAVLVLILLWVLPQLKDMNTAMGLDEQLPWLTRHLALIYSAGFGTIAGGVTLCTATWMICRRIGRKSPRWDRIAEGLTARTPVAASVQSLARESRLLKQLGTLLKGGTTLPRALEIIAGNSPGAWERSEVLRLRSFLLLGTPFAEAFRSTALFQADSIALLEAGQESGLLEDYMLRLAQDLREVTRWKIQQATRILEPAFLMVLSVAIGGLILAYLLPMVRMLEQAGGAF